MENEFNPMAMEKEARLELALYPGWHKAEKECYLRAMNNEPDGRP